MGAERDTIQDLCKAVGREVHEAYPGLSLYFITHSTGQLADRVALAEASLANHPAAEMIRAILHRPASACDPDFLGMAVTKGRSWLGLLPTKDSMLALYSVNTDKYPDLKSLRRTLYHLAWHAIDLYELRQAPENKGKFKDGPMVPRRSPMNLAKANLQADVFAGALSAFRGDREALAKLGLERAEDSLSALTDRRAEDYPFVVALEAAQVSLAEAMKSPPSKNRALAAARHMSVETGKTFDKSSVQQWWAFSEPAQDMAWRGFSREEILGAAVNTSEDPFVRATGYLIADITGIAPLSAASLTNRYNSFANVERNERLHKDLADTVFEEAITLGMEEESGRAFLNAANVQNEDLTNGKIVGWCAYALQAAARAFETALASGLPAEDAARRKFEDEREMTTWDAIRDLGAKIIEQRRMGYAVTLGHIAEICHANPAFAPMLQSLKITINDPAYMQKLAAANDLNLAPTIHAPAPKAAAPRAPVPKAPAPEAAPVMAPSLGLGGPGAASHALARTMPETPVKNSAAHQLRKRLMEQQKKSSSGGEDRKE